MEFSGKFAILLVVVILFGQKQGMDLSAIIPGLLPHYNEIGHFHIAQSLVASIIGNVVFFVLLRIYVVKKKRGKGKNSFVHIIEMIYEQIYSFLGEIGGHAVTPKALMVTSTLFLYILRHNIFGLLGDMIVLVWPW